MVLFLGAVSSPRLGGRNGKGNHPAHLPGGSPPEQHVQREVHAVRGGTDEGDPDRPPEKEETGGGGDDQDVKEREGRGEVPRVMDDLRRETDVDQELNDRLGAIIVPFPENDAVGDAEERRDAEQDEEGPAPPGRPSVEDDDPETEDRRDHDEPEPDEGAECLSDRLFPPPILSSSLHRDPHWFCMITLTILKMGRYMATTMPPTTPPITTIMSGSMIDVRPSTAVSTSSS